MALNLAEELSSITTNVPASDWREAIRRAGDGLVAGGVTTEDYTDQMIAAVEEHGPYIVVAPGVALAHARPSESVKKGGLSWVSLASPVEFGHKSNDPVSLVIGLAALDHTAHIEVLRAVAGVLSDPATRKSLEAAGNADEIRALLSSATSAK